MTPEGTVIDSGLGPSLLTPVQFACGSCPNLFRLGAVLVPDVADPGAVAVVGAAFTMRTDGVTVGCIPDTLTRCLSSGPASDAYARHTHTSVFDQGFLFLLDGQYRAHLFNRGRIIPLCRGAHRHRRDNERVGCVYMSGCGQVTHRQKASWTC